MWQHRSTPMTFAGVGAVMMAWVGVLAFVVSAGCSSPQPVAEPTESPPAAPADESQVAKTSPVEAMQPILSASEASPAPQGEPKAAEPAKTVESIPSAGQAQLATLSDTPARSHAAPQAKATQADPAPPKAKKRTHRKQQPPADRESPAPEAKPAKKAEKKEKPKKASSGCGSSASEPPWALEVGKPQDEASAGQGQPRWVCDHTTVKAEPVWEGKPVTFKFPFRNEGETVLRVKAKGG
jgi:hypothetical protein